MNLTGFTDQQKQTLLDLLTIGMYVDGNLASAEDAKIEGVLDTIKFSSQSERDRFIDASFTRARQHVDSPQSTRDFIADIARHFPTQDLRQKAYSDLDELLSSGNPGNKVDEKANRVLAMVREEFKL